MRARVFTESNPVYEGLLVITDNGPTCLSLEQIVAQKLLEQLRFPRSCE